MSVFVLADRVRDVAREAPGRTAVVEADGSRRTYAELSRAAERLAPGLREAGISEGTLTVFMVPPGFEGCVIGVALSRVGAPAVGIEPSLGPRVVAGCLRRVEPEAFVGIPLAHLGRVAYGWGRGSVRVKLVTGGTFPGARRVGTLFRGAGPAEDEAGEAPPPPAVRPDDPALIAFTTGSTGMPKPAVFTHAEAGAMLEVMRGTWGWDDGDVPVDMPTFPAFWLIGLSAGGTVVVPPMDFARGGPAKADPARLLETIDRHGVRSMFASPALLENLSRHAAAHGRTAPSLERVVCGGAPVHGPLMRRVRRMLGPGGEVYSAYGTTEALPSAQIAGREVLETTWELTEQGAGVCLGRPLAGVSAEVVGFVDGPIESWADAVRLPPDEIGEIVVRGPNISQTYYRSEEQTRANKIPDPEGRSWHRTGDAGYRDAEGRLWLVGRVSHRVDTKDGTIFPLQVEPIVNTHPAVRRSALVGVDGVPIVVIEPEPDLPRPDPATIMAELPVPLAGITTVLVHPGFPVDTRHNAKVDRPALARWAESRLPR
ncbi:fatty acid CoA ligase family protein [Bailinhaonella thermotolerans]|uniref:AMP-dependent synthetase/ligase domain-containing protein n=1 Tax=Bailinhaonella thermotolerans TaxID=1070861 RepID=A0A3A4B686_9ACTN|nr:fatty acid CoA ligase family protein [Bailinhaonella thermotolerans]RJL34077.1 hypothetical protein D5H75_06175 [Bailinhaonella thermotolerans]